MNTTSRVPLATLVRQRAKRAPLDRALLRATASEWVERQRHPHPAQAEIEPLTELLAAVWNAACERAATTCLAESEGSGRTDQRAEWCAVRCLALKTEALE